MVTIDRGYTADQKGLDTHMGTNKGTNRPLKKKR